MDTHFEPGLTNYVMFMRDTSAIPTASHPDGDDVSARLSRTSCKPVQRRLQLLERFSITQNETLNMKVDCYANHNEVHISNDRHCDQRLG